MSEKSYSQRKRDKFDYRTAYFKHNPGLFGCIWFCAYCHRPIVGRQNVQVDHIMPLNNVLGQNKRFNLVAACEKCNKAKSDKVDGRVVKGYLSKLFESIIFTIQKIVVVGIVGFCFIIHKLLSGIFMILTIPFRNTSFVVKLVAVGVYAVVIYFALSKF